MIPKHISESPLFRQGGYGVYDSLLSPTHMNALLKEAIRQLPSSTESSTRRSCAEEWRGGNPVRRFLSAPAGAVQDEFYLNRETEAFLETLLHCKPRPTGLRGTFTYYARPGDFIGIHRDVDACDLAVITCLSDSPPADEKSNAGKMVFYPDRIDEPNSGLRRDPANGARLYRLLRGQTAILLGGVIPHAVLPVAPAQVRIVSVLCYAVPGA